MNGKEIFLLTNTFLFIKQSDDEVFGEETVVFKQPNEEHFLLLSCMVTLSTYPSSSLQVFLVTWKKGEREGEERGRREGEREKKDEDEQS